MSVENNVSGGSGAWWVVVTGASQGYGATICTSLAPLLPSGSRVIGIARSKEGLTNTAAEVKKINPDITFISAAMDLGTVTATSFEAVLREHFGTEQPKHLSQALVFHNAGSLGPLKYLRELDDSVNLSSYFDLNISSVISINTAFLKFTSSLPANVTVKIINISSLCAVEPFKSWGLYCVGKAGRKMLFRVLAAENPNIRVLSYSPGPLDTDMQVKARTESQDDGIRSAFCSMKAEGKLLSCETSVSKLLRVLEKDEFKSGDHVDFFDD